MKKIIKKTVALALCAVLLITSLTGCASLGKPLLEYESVELTDAMFSLFLSRIKGTVASASNAGSEALTSSYWDATVSSDGTTRGDAYKAQVLSDAKSYVAALYEFERLGLKLPDSYVEEIDAELMELVEFDADGSKTAFNAILAEYGANYDVLREAYLLEAKLAYLNEYLYGAAGEKIGEEVIEEYYQNNYLRFKHVFFYTYALVYVEDEDGKEIYYIPDSGGSIAYDTSAFKRRDASGDVVTDKNGDVVYETADGFIAYDKERGERQPVYDENGYIMTRQFTQSELIAVSDDATLLMDELRGEEGNYTLFDSFVESYSEDEGSATYSNGMYLAKNTEYIPQVTEALAEMEEGEIRKVYSDYGIHIVMKYELDEGGYADSRNSDFFISNSTGTYTFLSTLMSELLMKRLAPIKALITVDEKLYDSIDIKYVGANFYY